MAFKILEPGSLAADTLTTVPRNRPTGAINPFDAPIAKLVKDGKPFLVQLDTRKDARGAALSAHRSAKRAGLVIAVDTKSDNKGNFYIEVRKATADEAKAAAERAQAAAKAKATKAA